MKWSRGNRPLLEVIFKLSLWYKVSYRMIGWRRWVVVFMSGKHYETPLDAEDLIKTIWHPLQPIRKRYHVEGTYIEQCEVLNCLEKHYYLIDTAE